MKKKPILINTSRGRVINHSALVEALSKATISGAGLDVLPYEPPHKEDPLLKFPNVIFSPHNAFCTPEALECRADIIITNIKSFIMGKPKNVVNNK
jgi:phosphoglycerate dehydrogenase-like enzyme